MSGRGWKRGVPRGPLSETTKEKIAESHRRRWQDPEIRHIIIKGILESYQDGELSHYKIKWDADMDQLLISIYQTHKFLQFRQIAPKKIGVGENAVCQRLRYLRQIGRIPPYVKPVRVSNPKPQKRTSKPSSKKIPPPIDPIVKTAQLAADAYVKSLLQNI